MKDEKIIRDKLYLMEADLPNDMWARISNGLPQEEDDTKSWLWIWLGIVITALALWWSAVAIFCGPQIIQDINPPQKTETQLDNISHSLNSTQDLVSIQPNNSYKPYELQAGEHTNTHLSKTFSKAAFAQGDRSLQNISSSKTNHNHITSFTPTNNTEVSNTENKSNSHNQLEDNYTFRNLLLPINSLASQENFSLYLPSTIIKMPAISDPQCPIFSKNQPGLFLDIYYSSDYEFRNFSPVNNEFIAYSQTRANTETSLYSFSTGMRLGYVLPSGFGMKAGLNYSQINERFKFIDPESYESRTVITIDTIFQNGMQTVVTDTSTIRIPGTTEITAYNRYRSFDLPVLLTYERELSAKTYFTINTGVIINFLFTQKGSYINPAGEVARFENEGSGSDDIYKNNIGLSLFASFGINHVWNDKLDLILEPNFRINTGSITSESYPLQQKYVISGLITGIRYKF